jgi:predicted RNA polymerase sigma factor
MPATDVENLLRQLTPQVLGAVVRRYGNFDLAEEATQEALLAAWRQWPRSGMPQDPKAWLVTVAARRLTDLLRSDQARRRRETPSPAGPSPKRRSDQSMSTTRMATTRWCCCSCAATLRCRLLRRSP